MKKFAEILLVRYSFVINISNISYCYCKQLLVIYFFNFFKSLKLIKKSYNNISKLFLSPIIYPKCKNSPAKFFIPSFSKGFSKFKILLDSVWNQRFVLKISSTLSYPSKFTKKIKELDYLLKNQQFLIDYIQKIQLTWWKNLQRCCLFAILLWLLSAIFLILTANTFWSFVFSIAFVYIFTYLEDLRP